MCPDNANKPKATESKSVKRAANPDTRFNTCDGSVDGNPMAFTLDTGVMISVIPQEYVSDMAEKCGEVRVTYTDGGTRVRQKVKVSIAFGGNIFNREVALALKSEIGDKGLFALNLCDRDDIHVMQQFVQANDPLETKAVLTRVAKAREHKQQELDDLAEHERNEELGKTMTPNG